MATPYDYRLNIELAALLRRRRDYAARLQNTDDRIAEVVAERERGGPDRISDPGRTQSRSVDRNQR